MKNEVMKILMIMASPNLQYFRAIDHGFSHPAYCITLVKMIGSVSKEMAIVGSITKVRKAIAAAGRPMPKKPLIMPAKRKIAITAMVIAISCDGRM